MYHGKNKTAISSQQQIVDALMMLMDEKPYASISISELCKAASVSRQTFYTLFNVRDNVILYALHEPCCIEVCQKSHTFDDMIRYYAHYIVDNKDLLGMLVRNDITYIISESFYDDLSQSSYLKERYTDQYRDYISRFVSGGLTGIITSYVNQGAKETETTLYYIMKKLLITGENY